MLKSIKNFVYKGEFLEFDVHKQLINSDRKKFLFFQILFKKILRNFYRLFQRNITRPSIRKIFCDIEKKIFKFSKTQENSFLNDTKIINNQMNNLKENSFTFTENLINKVEIEKIKTFLSNKSEIDIYETSLGRKMPMRYFKTEDIINCEEIMNVVNNEKLTNLLKLYFGCNFKLDWIWSWWSNVESSKDIIGPQLFHRDYESLNFVKLFIYLTDVNGLDGSHQVIKKSHNINKFHKIERYSDSQIYSQFDKKKDVHTIDGVAGTSFLVNSYAIHRGLKPLKCERLVLCYLFSIYPSRRSPKIPPLVFSQIKNNREKFNANKNIFSLFIDYKK